MFLSPLLGAVAAWFGTTMLVGLTYLGVLGALFQSVTWPPRPDVVTMALAFALGFSERLLATLLGAVEKKVVDGTGAAPVPPPPGPLPVPPGGKPGTPADTDAEKKAAWE